MQKRLLQRGHPRRGDGAAWLTPAPAMGSEPEVRGDRTGRLPLPAFSFRHMTLILGIDPGSRITGFGVVRDTGRGCEYVASGCIRTGNGALHERLQIVFRGVREVIQTYQPTMMGIEQVFMAAQRRLRAQARPGARRGDSRGGGGGAGDRRIHRQPGQAGHRRHRRRGQAAGDADGHASAETDAENRRSTPPMPWPSPCATPTPGRALCPTAWPARVGAAGACACDPTL